MCRYSLTTDLLWLDDHIFADPVANVGDQRTADESVDLLHYDADPQGENHKRTKIILDLIDDKLKKKSGQILHNSQNGTYRTDQIVSHFDCSFKHRHEAIAIHNIDPLIIKDINMFCSLL